MPELEFERAKRLLLLVVLSFAFCALLILQVGDTHLHKPLKDIIKVLTADWYSGQFGALAKQRDAGRLSADDFRTQVVASFCVLLQLWS